MPNGRSGGFAIRRKELKNLLEEFEGPTVIGSTVSTPLTANATRELLKKTWTFSGPIIVEEQDHKDYILHLKEWLTVTASSPLYAPLRECHVRWIKNMTRKHK